MELELVIIVLDLLLLRPQVYRHLLVNRVKHHEATIDVRSLPGPGMVVGVRGSAQAPVHVDIHSSTNVRSQSRNVRLMATVVTDGALWSSIVRPTASS